MALTARQEEVKENTFRQVSRGITTQLAGTLKENYEMLRLAFPDLASSSSLTNDDYWTMAQQAIDNRAVNFKGEDGNTVIITLDELNNKLMSNDQASTIITSRGASHLSEIVPTREQVSLIANAAGDAAAENTGNFLWSGTTPGNAISGGWNYITTLGGENSMVTPAASSIRQDATRNLETLAQQRPDIARVLGNDGIARIGDAIYNGAIAEANRDPNAPATPEEDPLDKVSVLPVNDAIRAQVAEGIHREVYSSTRAVITQRVEDGVNKIRNGGGLMGFIFKIAEFLGLEKLLAKMFGQPIPEKQEINNVSRVVADSVTQTVTEHGASMDREQLVDAVRSNVQNNLRQARKGAFSSFSDEQIAEIANGAANGINEQYASIPKLPPSETLASARDAVHPDAQGLEVAHATSADHERANIAAREVNERSHGQQIRA